MPRSSRNWIASSATFPYENASACEQMVALVWSGRQADALRSYQSARAVLADELGLEPSHELRMLETSILRQDESIVAAAEAVPPRVRTNLRTPFTSLIGRTGELAALRTLLQTQRLVTLVGPGGSGKTRLALESGLEWLGNGEGEAWLVELADVSDPEGVVTAIANVLELRYGSGAETVHCVAEYLCGRRVLMLLDNCEHVVACAADVAQELLELCPTLTILTTSREALGVTGEVLWPVPPLPLDDAVELFVERGRAVAPMSVVAENRSRTQPLLREICTRLDGLPLAIELAAAGCARSHSASS